jgi:murein DD-endopeptidase MepM/ murein hydrolase activator NlpD
LRACAIAITGLALVVGMVAAAAEDMKGPRISSIRMDWDALSPELLALERPLPLDSPDATQDNPQEEAKRPPATAADVIARINLTTGNQFANIASSPVPVLLPLDTPALLRDRAEAADATHAQAGNYLLGFNSVPFFYAGPGGYDAVVVARAQEMRDLGIGFADPIYIHISGSALLYELDEPAGMIEWPVTQHDEFPGLRRVFLENYVRYFFSRYGVPYVIAIECFDGGSRYRKISCRDADKVAMRMLKALHFAGGTPQQRTEGDGANTVDRPEEQSTVFTYFGPGDIIPGTGFKRKGGVADHTVYSKIRFPIADAPAFANSQFFTNWGDCEATGRYGMGTRGGIGAYRCRAGGQTPVRDERTNYSYPWRDNFCETRYFYVGQCPGGLGHQGQDIRPAFCKQRFPGGSRCEPYLHDVVAVRDGAVLRAANQESLYIVVNAPNERIRFRYLHMSPTQFDAAGMVSGRLVHEGEVLGKVGNFYHREGATTYHLHFDAQVPSKYGWVFVNPYMTLVASYERLIRGRGQEIKEEIAPNVAAGSGPKQPAAPAPPGGLAALAAKPTETAIESAPEQTIDSGMRRDEQMDERSSVTTSLPAIAGGSNDGVEHEGAGTGRQIGLRPLDRGISRTRSRAWHIRRHLHASDDQP